MESCLMAMLIDELFATINACLATVFWKGQKRKVNNGWVLLII